MIPKDTQVRNLNAAFDLSRMRCGVVHSVEKKRTRIDLDDRTTVNRNACSALPRNSATAASLGSIVLSLDYTVSFRKYVADVASSYQADSTPARSFPRMIWNTRYTRWMTRTIRTYVCTRVGTRDRFVGSYAQRDSQPRYSNALAERTALHSTYCRGR